MSKFLGHKYTYVPQPWGSKQHRWELRTSHGGVHLSVNITRDNDVSCGLEFHSIYPRRDEAPHHVDCPLTGGRCWHDGTSLYAMEALWPKVSGLLDRGQHDDVFRILEYEAKRLEEYSPGWKSEQ